MVVNCLNDCMNNYIIHNYGNTPFKSTNQEMSFLHYQHRGVKISALSLQRSSRSNFEKRTEIKFNK